MACFEKDQNRTRAEEKSWGEIAGRLFFSVAALAGGYAENIVEKQKARAFRSVISYFFLFLAVLFILNGLALFLGELLEIRIWVGFLLVGLGLIVVGLIVSKSRN